MSFPMCRQSLVSESEMNSLRFFVIFRIVLIVNRNYIVSLKKHVHFRNCFSALWVLIEDNLEICSCAKKELEEGYFGNVPLIGHPCLSSPWFPELCLSEPWPCENEP